jgi:hypothetical protein
LCAVISIIYLFFLTIDKFLTDYSFVWKMKWLNDLLSELIPLLVFITLAWLLQKIYNAYYNESNTAGYTYELEEESVSQDTTIKNKEIIIK